MPGPAFRYRGGKSAQRRRPHAGKRIGPRERGEVLSQLALQETAERVSGGERPISYTQRHQAVRVDSLQSHFALLPRGLEHARQHE